MSKKLMCCLAVVMLALTVTTLQAGTLVLQGGVDGYAGTQDNFVISGALDPSHSSNNYGAYSGLYAAKGAAGATDRGVLVRFTDLVGEGAGQIPAGSVIVSAQLELTAEWRVSQAASDKVLIYQMLKNWAEGTSAGAIEEGASCFDARKYRSDGDYANNPGDAWGNNGQIETGPVAQVDWNWWTEVKALMNCSVYGTYDTNEYVMSFDVTSMAREWAAHPDQNFGVYGLLSGNNTMVKFYSSDSTEQNKRPKLTLVYDTPEGYMESVTAAQYRMDRLSYQTPWDINSLVEAEDVSGNSGALAFHRYTISDPDDPFTVSHSQSAHLTSEAAFLYGEAISPSSINLAGNAANAFTMEGWFKPNSWIQDIGFMHFKSTEGGTTHLMLRTDFSGHAKAQAYIKGTGWVYLTGTTVLPLDTWTHLALVGESTGRLKLYVNGQLQAQGFHTASSLPATAEYFRVGWTSDQGQQFLGHIDDVRLCSDALTSEQLGYNQTFTVTRTVYADAAEFGGFNATDATSALQNALNCDEATKVIIPDMGTPWIVEPIYVEFCSDMDIEFEEGVVLQAKAGSFSATHARLLTFITVFNTNILGNGAVLQMQKQEYIDNMSTGTYDASEWRHALQLYRAEDMTIQDLTVKDSGGDGINVTSDIRKNLPCKNISIDNVVSTNNYRQGMSVMSVEGLLVENSVFEGTAGTSPEAGIDIEPSYDNQTILDITILNCVFANNTGHGLQTYLSYLDWTSIEIEDIVGTVENCTFYANGNSGVKLYEAIPNLSFMDNLFVDNGAYGMSQSGSPAASALYSAFWNNTSGAASGVTIGTGCLTAVEPTFASTTFGDDNFMYLASSCPASITAGAQDGGFMGAMPVDAAPVLPGDANLDGAVDVGDLGILAANYGTVTGATWGLGDFNGDGAVDVGDLGILAANYGSGSSSSADFDADYAKVFGSDAQEEAEADTSICSLLGLPLVIGLILMGLMLVKFKD